MPSILCKLDPSLCDDPSVPTANFSSESPDRESFFGRNYGTGLEPPLGTDWRASSCLGTCVSQISQADADQCAQRANITCLSNEWPVLEPNPNPNQPDDPFIPVPRRTFGNDIQECNFVCPDDSVFTQQIPADVFLGFSQAAADASALSLCQTEVVENRICFGEISPVGCCADSLYDGSVAVSGLQPPYTITVVGGSIDPLVLSQNPTTAFLSGIPLVAGTISFTLRAQDSEGNFAEKSFVVKVAEIATSSPLPEADFGQPYSQALTTIQTTGDVTWSVTGGALPSGLTLGETTGVVSGTPSQSGTFTFTATATDEAGVSCSKEFEVEVTGSCTNLASDAAWTFNPNGNPDPTGYSLSYNVVGYFGSFQASKGVGALVPPVDPPLTWRTDWTSVIGQTLTVRATMVGTVNRVGQGATTFRVNSIANGNLVTDSQLCPAGVITAINLEAIAQDASLGGATHAIADFETSSSGTWDVSGTIEVSCA